MRLWMGKLLYNVMWSIHVTEWNCKSTMLQMIAEKAVLIKLYIENADISLLYSAWNHN